MGILDLERANKINQETNSKQAIQERNIRHANMRFEELRQFVSQALLEYAHAAQELAIIPKEINEAYRMRLGHNVKTRKIRAYPLGSSPGGSFSYKPLRSVESKIGYYVCFSVGEYDNAYINADGVPFMECHPNRSWEKMYVPVSMDTAVNFFLRPPQFSTYGEAHRDFPPEEMDQLMERVRRNIKEKLETLLGSQRRM